ncbi:hypothetical protein J2S74_002098 [Evansella vedderi]|uniref:Uncharacterized protein n=1 Tax=Evansella vedderi TaxID=38282 RepID=A0ABT9ZU34_9BACI|nr:hypothetical protein [Evansella vedderi]
MEVIEIFSANSVSGATFYVITLILAIYLNIKVYNKNNELW